MIAMAKFLGRVNRTELEGGRWTLITEEGVVYQLKGGGPDLLRNGAQVEIEGRIATKQVGITIIGDFLEVKQYRVLD